MVPAVSLTMTFPKHVIERRRTTVEEPDTMSSRAVAKNADNEICGTVPLGMGSVLNEDGVSALLQQQKSKTSRPESSLRPTRRPVPGSAIGSHGMVTEVEDENFNDNVIGGCDGHGLWLGRRLHRCGSARAHSVERALTTSHGTLPTLPAKQSTPLRTTLLWRARFVWSCAKVRRILPKSFRKSSLSLRRLVLRAGP